MKVAFGPFTLDSDTRQLLKHDRAVHLSPKAFDLLELLLARRPAVLTKAEAQDRLWPDTFVEDANLSVLVADIRRALDDDPKDSKFIRTVHGRGYAFSATADHITGRAAPAEPARWWLTWGDQIRPLVQGENIVGRDPGCAVWIDARGVSRRHARILLSPDGAALIEDLASTNGTFVGEQRLAAPQRLADGDIVGLGPENVTYRCWSPDQPAATEAVRRQRRRPKPAIPTADPR
jgi:DNA-binding winged helix-turn-helix (wHTH) protein